MKRVSTNSWSTPCESHSLSRWCSLWPGRSGTYATWSPRISTRHYLEGTLVETRAAATKPHACAKQSMRERWCSHPLFAPLFGSIPVGA
jgi:hypothetical protein